jgi:hypothetical protein
VAADAAGSWPPRAAGCSVNAGLAAGFHAEPQKPAAGSSKLGSETALAEPRSHTKRQFFPRPASKKEIQTMPTILMWLIGIPIPIIILLLIFGVL